MDKKLYIHSALAQWFVSGKKDRKMRLCINYRELNKKIHPNGMSIPRI